MAKLQVYRSAVASVSPPRLRVHRAALAGTANVNPRLRVHRAALAGTGAALLLPIADVTTEPEQAVTITAVPAPGAETPTSWTWTQISGPSVALTGAGASRSFRSPSLFPPGNGTVVLGVTGALGASTSPQVTATVTVLPQTDWTRVPGGGWVGAAT